MENFEKISELNILLNYFSNQLFCELKNFMNPNVPASPLKIQPKPTQMLPNIKNTSRTVLTSTSFMKKQNIKKPPSNASFILKSMTNLTKQMTMSRRNSYEVKQLTSSISDLTNTIIIQIESNYGNPKKISCSSLDILGSHKRPLPIKSITYKSLPHCNTLQKLVNGVLIKNNEKDIWWANWPPQPPMTNITIIIHTIGEVPDSIRVWPNPMDPTSNLKNIKVYSNGVLYYSGDLPETFGLIIPLKEVRVEDDESDDENHKNEPNVSLFELKCLRECQSDFIPPLFDKYGEIPTMSCQNITIGILDSYGDPEIFSIQNIKIFDMNGEAMDVVQNCAIEAESCGNCPSPNFLFINSKNKESDLMKYKTENNSYNEYKSYVRWHGRLSKPMSKIHVRFKTPVKVSCIQFSTIVKSDEDIKIAARKVNIFAANKKIWAGRLKLSKNYDRRGCNSNTFVFFAENETLQNKILDNNDV
ncbi:hypothetical protein TRFO_01285 [Tritrichomonas foetus]|uniref:KATNIP domain-containing protein n=1 Tax=Tritrichomonas foetus TaxID=1144522 RepID=A0A1J4K6R9_9EUKA|nr:hypothetical protein TRFO_01285 [Tritrichomonas foetus]|eukprot:OHT07161.1 hypothetical protein TRFO_01285 [Tritrichomonas foetus]